MLEKVKKYGVIIIIAILFSMFVFSIVDVIIEQPDYVDFCGIETQPMLPVQKDVKCTFTEPTEQQVKECEAQKGFIKYKYDAFGCPESFKCDNCSALFEEAGKGYRLAAFIISTIFGIIAIIAGMYIKSKNDVVEWVFSGILIGGIASVFIGTMQYFQDMGRFVKPFILLAEMALIIWVAVKTAMKKKKK